MTMGVYCIQIEKDNYWQSYVGISKNIEQRWNQHKTNLRGSYHDNKYLQRSWDKHGERMFEFFVLEEVDCYDRLYELEKEYAYAFGYNDFDLCFNIGTPGEINPNVGRKLSEETKQKMSEAHKGEKNHMFGKKGEKSQNFGKKFSEETKQKISEANKGEKNDNVKLTELQARFILTIKTTRKNQNTGDFIQQELANYFGVSVGCVREIMQHKTWKHIEPLPIEEYEQMKQIVIQKLKEGSEKF